MEKRVKLIIASKHKETKSIYRKLITWYTKSKYYHTEIIIDNKWISSNPDTGVRIRDLKPLRPGYDYKTLYVTITEEQYATLWNWINSKTDSKYDNLGILLSQVLPARIDDPNRWFCSEIVAKILQLCLEPKSLDLTPNMVSPKTLIDLYGIDKED